ncbi:MAG: dihydrodipicolinate synthase family protein, partial [Actinobacteria bacterium]|nr:dihydrodipicolinate synthase family protein [Actinomycetota bacterium]
MRFDGVWVPIITPFDEMGNVDRGKLADFVDIMIDQGVDGIVAVGTTGEAYAL